MYKKLGLKPIILKRVQHRYNTLKAGYCSGAGAILEADLLIEIVLPPSLERAFAIFGLLPDPCSCIAIIFDLLCSNRFKARLAGVLLGPH